MPHASARKPEIPPDPQFGEDVKKPDGSKPQMGEFPPAAAPLDAATKAVLDDKNKASPPPIIPSDE